MVSAQRGEMWCDSAPAPAARRWRSGRRSPPAACTRFTSQRPTASTISSRAWRAACLSTRALLQLPPRARRPVKRFRQESTRLAGRRSVLLPGQPCGRNPDLKWRRRPSHRRAVASFRPDPRERRPACLSPAAAWSMLHFKRPALEDEAIARRSPRPAHPLLQLADGAHCLRPRGPSTRGRAESNGSMRCLPPAPAMTASSRGLGQRTERSGMIVLLPRSPGSTSANACPDAVAFDLRRIQTECNAADFIDQLKAYIQLHHHWPACVVHPRVAFALTLVPGPPCREGTRPMGEVYRPAPTD